MYNHSSLKIDHMRYIFLFILNISISITYCAGQNQSDLFSKKAHIIHNDSIVVRNKANFFRFKYTGSQYKEQDAIKFKLEVTNKGTLGIPDIQTARWQSEIHIYINGYDAMEMSLANFTYGGEELLVKNAEDSWDFDLQITGPDAIDFGPIFTWQWEYMGIKSAIVQIDITKRTITEVDKHISNDKKIY